MKNWEVLFFFFYYTQQHEKVHRTIKLLFFLDYSNFVGGLHKEIIEHLSERYAKKTIQNDTH